MGLLPKQGPHPSCPAPCGVDHGIWIVSIGLIFDLLESFNLGEAISAKLVFLSANFVFTPPFLSFFL